MLSWNRHIRARERRHMADQPHHPDISDATNLPMVAGETIITAHQQAHTLQPWPGFGAAALGGGFALISRRDA
jgi:hypothetical protein